MSQGRSPRMTDLGDGVWAYIQPDGGWMVNNMAVVETDQGLVSVDVTSTERRTRDYLDAVATTTGHGVEGRRVDLLLLTHAHPDHCTGSSLVTGAEVVSHAATAAALEAPVHAPPGVFEPITVGDAHAVVPGRTFETGLTLTRGDEPIEVRHPGVIAHTTGDAYVWFPERSLLLAADLVFEGGTPFALSGSVTGWLTALDELRTLAATTVVPGHGEIAGRDVIDDVAEYLELVLEAAGRGLAAGLTPLECARDTDLGRFVGLIDPERIAGNLHVAYRDLDATHALDPVAAFRDMVELNGGLLATRA
ncbi:MBL fold metallo-hydrolase [Georgenia sp. Z1491]|uniref:MBL fold metallo-hydrolase n=1 Tax=Georgenia sp. Z1491 TaxID=3416707 RepID=UPI003CEB3E5B